MGNHKDRERDADEGRNHKKEASDEVAGHEPARWKKTPVDY
jgi:hypothetical protein